MSEDCDVVEEAPQTGLRCHADDLAQAVQLPLLLVAGAEEEIRHVVGERISGTEGRVYGLDVDPILGVFLPVRRQEVDGPLGPMLLEWYVDVLDA